MLDELTGGAIADFCSDAVENRNWHSAIGVAGIGVKYLAETVVGVQYPRGIEKGLPKAVKWVAKAVTATSPTLRGRRRGRRSSEEEDEIKGVRQSTEIEKRRLPKMESKEQEFYRRQFERESEYKRYKADRDRQAIMEEQKWELVVSR